MEDDVTKEIAMGSQFEIAFMVSADSQEQALEKAKGAVGHWLPLTVRSVKPVPADRTVYSYQVASEVAGERTEAMIAFNPGSSDPAVIVMLKERGDAVEEVGRVRMSPGELAMMARSLGWWPLEQMEQMEGRRSAVAMGESVQAGDGDHVCKYEKGESGGMQVVCQCGWRSRVLAGEQGLYTVAMVHRLAHMGFE